jgi:hypothetical protein
MVYRELSEFGFVGFHDDRMMAAAKNFPNPSILQSSNPKNRNSDDDE